MKPSARSMEKILEEQMRRWEISKREKVETKRRSPVIAISRQPGSQGGQIAKNLADLLGIDLFNREIIHRVAKSARMSSSFIETLDERGRIFVEDWISATVDERHLSPDDYLRYLMQVIATIAKHGGAVIIGRGANFVLPRSECFSLRIVAPESIRIGNLMHDEGLSEDEARRHMIKLESDRRAFVRKYFNADIDDPVHYDLVINTENLSVDRATRTVLTGLNGTGVS